MYLRAELGHEEAYLAVDACVAELKTRGKAGTVAVSDAHGELIALLRMDGAGLATATIATNKVFTSARLKQASGDIGKASTEGGWDVHFHGDERYLGWEGGAPVFHNGACVGAVSISGLTGEEDYEIALVGVAAITAKISGQ